VDKFIREFLALLKNHNVRLEEYVKVSGEFGAYYTDGTHFLFIGENFEISIEDVAAQQSAQLSEKSG